VTRIVCRLIGGGSRCQLLGLTARVGRGAWIAAGRSALLWWRWSGGSQRAQLTDLSVTVNGEATAPGTYDSASIFQATCQGTENNSGSSGDAALYQLSWVPLTDDQIFWDTAATT